MGMKHTLQALKEESNITMEMDAVVDLRVAVLQGDWERAIDTLGQIVHSIQLIEPFSLNLREWYNKKRWRTLQDLGLAFLRVQIYEEQFLEELEQGNLHVAMRVLREHIKLENPPASVLERLARMLLCSSPEDVRRTARWPGAAGGARQVLVHNIELWFSPKDMLPSDRLDTLLRQALTYQRAQHPYHALDSKDLEPSLLMDYRPASNTFPRRCTFMLQGHTNEVWVAKFSHKSTILATGGKDGRVIMWDTENHMEALAVLQHAEPISCIAWSPDDTKLLVSTEEDVVEWNLTDRTAHVLSEHECCITALQWLPDPLPAHPQQDSMYVTGALDHKIHFWSWGGRKKKTLDFTPYRILGLDVSRNGQYMVVLGWNSPPELAHLKLLEKILPKPGEDDQAAINRFPDLMRRYNGRMTRVHLSPESQFFQTFFSNLADAEDPSETDEPVGTPSGEYRTTMNGSRSSFETDSDSKEDISDDCLPYFMHARSRMKPMRVWVWDNVAQTVIHAIDFPIKFNYTSFSQDGQHVLLSQAHGPVHMMDVETGSIVQKFYGRKASSAVLRTAFAYQGDDFVHDIGTYVTSGSDDGRFYIWHRATGQLLHTSFAHPEGRVNDMVWGRGPAQMLASCGDDGTVRVWEPGNKKSSRPVQRTLSKDVPVYHAPKAQGSCSQRNFEVHPPLSLKERPDQPANAEVRRLDQLSLSRHWEDFTAHRPHRSDGPDHPSQASSPSQGSAQLLGMRQ